MNEHNKKSQSKVLRGIVITLMSLAVVITLLSAAGTICVAFGAEKFEKMVSLVPYKPLYQAFVVIGIGTGIWGIAVIRSIFRGGPKVYRNALLVLIIGAVSAGIQMAVSQIVRGNSAPINVRFYITIFTLAVFLLLRMPPARNMVDFTKPGKGGSSAKASAGTAFFVCGIITLTTHFWTGTTHITSSGYNWINGFKVPLNVAGLAMIISGAVFFSAALCPLRKCGREKKALQSFTGNLR